MLQREARPFRLGFLAAILAATLQFVLLAFSLSGAYAQAGDADPSLQAGHCGDGPSAPAGHDAACALCPICLVNTLPGLLPPQHPIIPTRSLRSTQATPAPFIARLHAARVPEAAFPRGPPLI